ncbi:MAG: choice-of-anchor V domain-containing protein [Acidobacteriota bacterium]
MKILRTYWIILLVMPAVAFGYKNGISGRTLKSSTNGCSCHNSSAASSVLVAITGPSSLIPGRVGTYTVTVNDVPGNSGGIDIAASSGTLAPASTNLKLLNGELTQTTSTAVPSTYSFTYTAPASAGTATLYATAKGTAFASWNHAPNFTVTVTNASAVTQEGQTPAVFALEQNFPNPFNPSTQIRFSIPQAQHATLAIYDMQGREVAVLVNARLEAGTYSTQWNAEKMPTGVYLYRLKAGTLSETKKLLIQK